MPEIVRPRGARFIRPGYRFTVSGHYGARSGVDPERRPWPWRMNTTARLRRLWGCPHAVPRRERSLNWTRRSVSRGCFELLFAAALIYIPFLQDIFGTAALGAQEMALLATFPPLVWDRTNCGNG